MRLKGSYTIEATYIMGITCFVLAALIGAAYDLKEEIIGYMQLHEQVEKLRYQEEGNETVVVRSADGTGWSLEIRARVFDQELWLRKISLIEEYIEE